MNTKNIIKTYISSHIKDVVSLILLTLLAVLLKIANPIFIKVIIDCSLNNFEANKTTIIILTTLMGVVTFASFGIDALRQNKSVQFGNEITSELRSRGYGTIMKAELHEINKIDKQDLCKIIVDETHEVGNNYIANRLIKLLCLSVTTIAFLITMIVFKPLFGFITAITLPIFYFITQYLGKLSNKKATIYTQSKENHEKLVNDHIEQLKTIKVRNGLNKETDDYETILKENKKSYSADVFIKDLNKIMSSDLFVGIIWFSVFLTCCIWLFQSDFVLAAELGGIVGSIIIAPKIYSNFKRVLDIYFAPYDISLSYTQLDRIYAIKAESRSETIPSLEEIHSLKFDSVSFDYANYGINGKVSLDKIDFEIKKGERLGVLGLPMSGKTTIADLIAKVIRPRQGSVLINNCDINKLNTYYLRDIVTCVPQNFQLLEGSIENNIIYPLPLDEYKYNASLNKCKLKELVFALPKRDETIAREANLNSSEIQKISLANAFYKDSPIMILDDATSKLDPSTETEIMNEVYKLKNKITIIISNRIYNVAKCDKIIIMNNGKVAEYGKVEDLIADSKSTFARMLNDYQANKKIV